jgi:predicted DsbA family dithiol-disulfide isomerase
MHDVLLARQHNLRTSDLLAYAEQQGLDVDRFRDELRRRVHTARVAQDVESADLSNVSGTPTFFINGQRHYGAYDVESLSAAIRTARARARLVPAADR